VQFNSKARDTFVFEARSTTRSSLLQPRRAARAHVVERERDIMLIAQDTALWRLRACARTYFSFVLRGACPAWTGREEIFSTSHRSPSTTSTREPQHAPAERERRGKRSVEAMRSEFCCDSAERCQIALPAVPRGACCFLRAALCLRSALKIYAMALAECKPRGDARYINRSFLRVSRYAAAERAMPLPRHAAAAPYYAAALRHRRHAHPPSRFTQPCFCFRLRR